MFQNMIDYLFGCAHKNYSFPITAKRGKQRSEAADVTGTYIVCLDCGREFPYDWRAMKVVEIPRKKAAAAAMGETADEPLPRSA
jgi:hypothetical protein